MQDITQRKQVLSTQTRRKRAWSENVAECSSLPIEYRETLLDHKILTLSNLVEMLNKLGHKRADVKAENILKGRIYLKDNMTLTTPMADVIECCVWGMPETTKTVEPSAAFKKIKLDQGLDKKKNPSQDIGRAKEETCQRVKKGAQQRTKNLDDENEALKKEGNKNYCPIISKLNKDIDSYPLLSAEDEIRLGTIIKNGKKKIISILAQPGTVHCLSLFSSGARPIAEELQQLWNRSGSHDNNSLIKQRENDLLATLVDEVIDRWPTRRRRKQLLSHLRMDPNATKVISVIEDVFGDIHQAEDAFVLHNLRLARISTYNRSIRNNAGGNQLFFNYWEAAVEALYRAASRFDPDKNTRFATYTRFWFSVMQNREEVMEGRMISLSTYVVTAQNAINRVARDYYVQYGEQPSIEHIAERLGLEEKVVTNVIVSCGDVIPLNKPITHDSDDGVLQDLKVNRSAPTPEEIITQRALVDDMKSVLSVLAPREKKVLELRCGINCDREYTLEEIGKMFCVTRERIRQIEAKAIDRLRKYLDKSDIVPTRIGRILQSYRDCPKPSGVG